MSELLLSVKDLHMHYITEDETIRAVNGVSFDLRKGESVGLVGETGAGKTTTALSIMRLVQSPPGLVASGEIIFEGKNLLELTENEMRKIRGNRVAMIFQDPMTSLNPTMTVQSQIAEVLSLHQNLTAKEANMKAIEMLEKVGIRADRARDYPHQFSGGMRQRVGIAIALACNPALLIADEPTTALDVTIQAQVLELMKELKQEFASSMIMITHDLGIVAEICDKVAIMYAGSIVEFADVYSLYDNPKHPYTIGLLNSLPDIEKDMEKLMPIKGLMPDPTDLPSGCPFHPRCDSAMEKCSEQMPTSTETTPGHFVKCLLFVEASQTEADSGLKHLPNEIKEGGGLDNG